MLTRGHQGHFHTAKRFLIGVFSYMKRMMKRMKDF